MASLEGGGDAVTIGNLCNTAEDGDDNVGKAKTLITQGKRRT